MFLTKIKIGNNYYFNIPTVKYYAKVKFKLQQ